MPANAGPGSTADDGPDSLATFDTDPEPTEPEPRPDPEPFLTKPRGTVIGLALAVLVTVVTILAARSLLLDAGFELGIGELVTVGLIGLAVALVGFLPLRWGLWVVPLVAAAHYALNLYNMLLTDNTVYQFVEGDAMGYAVLTPAIGVVFGWFVEGVYRVVAPE